MNKKLLILCVGVLLTTTLTREAASGAPDRSVIFKPGYLGLRFPLAGFASGELKEACVTLQKGDLSHAKEQFDRVIKINRDSYVANLGQLQAVASELPSQLPQLRRTAATDSSGIAQFRLGAADAIVLSTQYQEKRPGTMALQREAQTALLAAWNKDHDPVGGLLYNTAAAYSGFPRKLDIYEGILRRCAGKEAYAGYLRAKKSGWNAPLPPLPSGTPEDQFVSQCALYRLMSVYGGRSAKFVKRLNGKEEMVWQPRPSEREHAFQFLSRWYAAIEKKGFKEASSL